jgi:hypothetical protein
LAVTGQGVALTGAGDMQALGKNGAGVKVGVIDLGFAACHRPIHGDLPSNLSIVDTPEPAPAGSITAPMSPDCLEMAPGAQMYLAKINRRNCSRR